MNNLQKDYTYTLWDCQTGDIISKLNKIHSNKTRKVDTPTSQLTHVQTSAETTTDMSTKSYVVIDQVEPVTKKVKYTLSNMYPYSITTKFVK
jgi:hypothetical protein